MTVNDLKELLNQFDGDEPVVVCYNGIMGSNDVDDFLEFSPCFSMAKNKNQLQLEILKRIYE